MGSQKDSRFVNLNYREGYSDVSKKVLFLKQGQSVEFQIDFPLDHKLHFESIDKNIPEITLNGKPVASFVLQSESFDNVLKISAQKQSILTSLFLLPGKPGSEKKSNLLFLVIDSLRGDVPGFNGGKYGVTPNLDEFSRKSLVFEKHYVNSSWTRPSTLIFFTGQYPSKTYINFWDYPVFESEKKAFYASGIQTLPDYLSRKGYKTVLIGNNPFFTDHRAIGVDVGFEEVYEFSFLEKDTLHITNQFKKFWDLNKKDPRPVFVFLNYNDPHKPYEPPFEFVNTPKTPPGTDPRKKAYLGEVAFVDAEVRKVFEKIGDSMNQFLVLVTSDHGEVMNPVHARSPFNGVYTLFGHGQGLYEEDIHTPLLIKLPGQENSKRISRTSRSIDLFPSILDFLGFDTKPLSIDGSSLRPLIKGKESEERMYYGESRGVKGVRKGNFKLMKKTYEFHRRGPAWDGRVGPEPTFLYDLDSDPQESKAIKNVEIEKKLSPFFFREKDSKNLYTIRITNPGKEEKKVKIQIRSSIGKIQLEESGITKRNDTILNESPYGVFLEANPIEGSEEIQFSVYPDVSVPDVAISINGNYSTRGNFGVGDKDIFPNNCSLSKLECFPLYTSYGKPPRKPRNFRVQFWVYPSGQKITDESAKLETEAIEILKKQGYIQ